MQIEAANLRLADAVRLAGEGEREIRKIEKNGAVRVWFRGDEEREQPSREFALGDVVEIQRPGDLFKAAAPPKTIEEARERIFEHMQALGWTVTRHGFGRVNDYVTDPTDTVRLKLKPRAVALQVRWLDDNGRWSWNTNTRSLGSMKEFAADIEERSAKLIRVARARAEERYKSDAAAVGKMEPPKSAGEAPPVAAAAPSKADPVIIRYAYGEGVLLGGNTKEHKDAIKKLRTPYRFRYSRNLPGDAAWYVQRTRDTHQPRERIELLAAALRRSGVPVVVEYTEPEAERATKQAGRCASADQHTPCAAANEPPSAKVGRPPDNAKRATKLRELADKLEARANAELTAERQENTPRRASMAAHIRERARRQIVIAQAMHRAADAVAAGELEYIPRISSHAQMEDLDLALRRGLWERDRVTKRPFRDNEREPEVEDIDYVEFPRIHGSRAAIAEVLKDSAGIPNLDESRRMIQRYAKGSKDDIEIDVLDAGAVGEIIRAVKRDDSKTLSYAAERVAEQIGVIDRLGRLGVVNKQTLQAALREYLSCCRGQVQKGREDPAAARKRELRFVNIPGFVPTPRELAERIVAEAQIHPGMRVLEPSAGSGAIAEVIRERHPTARLEVVEHQYSLRELLKDDGFTVAGDDFLQFKPTANYDRIVMNPPFEKRQDTQHIARALDMLAPGGRLVGIAAASLATRDDADTRKLRGRIAELGGRIEQLPPGSFKESGTDVHTVLVVVDRPVEKKVEPVAKPVAVPTARPREGDSDLAKRWAEHTRNVDNTGLNRWANLEKTSCFVRSVGDISVTLCPAIQKHAIGACPPSQEGVKHKSKQLMLCQVDEDVEYFRGQEPGIIEAKAEAENRLLRGRKRRGESLGRLPEPAGDDFDAQELYLDALVPTRVVYRRSKPLDPISVSLGPPRVITTDGKSESVTTWKGPIPEDATLEVWVIAQGGLPLREFEAKLGEELIPYRGGASGATLKEVVGLIPLAERDRLAKAGVTLHDVQFGRFAGRSLYWLRSPDGAKTYGPITANGSSPTATELKAFVKESGQGEEAQPLPTLPVGWTLDDTIVLALMVDGRHVWSAWQPSTELGTLKGEGDEWAEPKRLPRRAEYKEHGAFDDFMHRGAATLWNHLERAPSSVRFRVAGPWLGVMFPTDFGKRVQFDPPTGGSLDVATLEQEFAEYTRLAGEHADTDSMLPRWVKVAPRRIAWAKQRLAAERRAAKSKPAARPKPAAKPKPEVKPEPAAASKVSPTPAAAVPEVVRPKLESKPEPATPAALAELAREHGITPDNARTVGDRSKLLYEAEQRGWGSKMRSWLIENQLVKPEWATEYGARARGRLAFKRGEEWPPPPARGETYSAAEYAGILASLVDAPEARAAMQLGTQWSEAMMRIPGAARFYRNHDLAQQVRRALEVRSNAVFDQQKTRAAARARYDWMKGVLEALTRDMKLSLDPSLYDKSREAAQVYKTLCEISNDVAQEILEELYGVRFPDKRDHYELCDGKQSLADLDRKATQRAREDAESKTECNRVRLADAKALLAVADAARSRGELTEKRFNLTYWRLHPELKEYQRDSRRLRLTWFPSFRQARGVAPQSSDKPTEAWVRGPSDHGFSTRAYRAAGEVAVVEALVTEIHREVAELERALGLEAKPTIAAVQPSEPKQPTSVSPAATPKAAATATTADGDAVDRREEANMSAKQGKKKTGRKKKAGAKKAGSKKAATAKKTGTKKAASKAKPATKAANGKVEADAPSKKRPRPAKVQANGAATKAHTNGAATKPYINGAAPKPASASVQPVEPKPKSASEQAPSRRSLRFKRNDVVRFRKRSQVAVGLGIGLDKEFKVEMVTTDEGRSMVVLRVGQGKHSALIKVPPGHLALIHRPEDVPAEVRACAARLARFKGPITPQTRRLLAELAGRV